MKAPTTLEDLLTLLKANAVWDTATLKHGELDWASLPTFGGEPAQDTECVWSWDDTHMIVGTCSTDIQIVAR